MSTQHPQSIPAVSPNPQRYLDKEQVAELLGVSKRTIDSWIACNFIPHTKMRRTIRFIPQEIDAWVRGESVTVRRVLQPGKVEPVEAA